jgi:hypothetical protein
MDENPARAESRTASPGTALPDRDSTAGRRVDASCSRLARTILDDSTLHAGSPSTP